MAPEQMTDFRNATYAADIYAFGCILHQLIDGSPRVPYAVQRAQSSPYDYIIKKCTETDPARRFKNVGTLRAVLFDELRRDSTLARSAATDQWASELPNISSWTAQRIEEFVAHLESVQAGNEAHVIADLREEHLVLLHDNVNTDWDLFSQVYCDWAKASFVFEFCDVIAGCLRLLAGAPRSGVAIRADAAVAMAVLATKNDRWYCMQLLHPLTNSMVPDAVAQRIAIEIRANDLAGEFEHCAAEVHGWNRSDYHPIVISALDAARVRP